MGLDRAADARSARPLGAALVAFVLVERRVQSPVLDLDLLLHNRLFAAANLAALLNYMALSAISVLTAIFLRSSRAAPPR